MEPRLAGLTQRLQSLGGPVPPEEIAERMQLLYRRLKGTMTPTETNAWNATREKAGLLPKDLAKLAKKQLFSSRGAFPEQRGGASFMEGLANKAKGFAESDKGQEMMGQAQSMFGPKPDPNALLGTLGKIAPGAAGMLGNAQGIASALASGNLSAIPRGKGPTLNEFLASQGVPVIPVKAKEIPGDFLGDGARWWVKAASSPYLGTLVKLTFFFMFFLSFLESIPVFGSVLSTVLDIVLSGGRVVVKILLKGIQSFFGLIPLPGVYPTGLVLVSVVGMFIWTLLAIIAFSRQDFTSAIESMIRIIPAPVGEAMADAFLDFNHTLGMLNEKRIKVMDELWNGILLIKNFVDQIGQYVGDGARYVLDRVKSGVNMLMDAVKGLQGSPEPPPPPFVPGASPVQPAEVPMAMPLPEGIPGAEMAPMATPVEVPMAQEAMIQPALGVPPAPVPEALPPPTPIPEALPPPAPVPEAVPPPAPVPEAVPPPAPVPEAVPPPTPIPEALPPPAPVPEAVPPPAPVPEALPPPAPVPETPAPVPDVSPPTFGPKPQSALERLRSGQSVNRDINVGRGFRGGKTLSAKRHKGRKWTSRQRLYERFFGAGLH